MKTQLKKEFKDKLLELRVYKKWRKNFIDGCGKDIIVNPDSFLKKCNTSATFSSFMAHSFIWENTPEGHYFWSQVSES